MFLEIDTSSPTPIYAQVASKLESAVLSGVFAPGEQLPSVRELSNQLTINPNTVVKAYQMLASTDLIIIKKGTGAFVKESVKDSIQQKRKEKWDTALKELVTEAINASMKKDDVINRLKKVWTTIDKKKG